MSRPFRRQDFDARAFYAALNKIRNLRDFTWRQVSAASGVSTTTLSRMADGRHPDAASLAALSHWGGMNPANFMTDPSKPPYDNSLTAIVARLRASIAWLRDGKPTENGGIGLGDMIDMLPIIEAALTPSPTPTTPQEAACCGWPGNGCPCQVHQGADALREATFDDWWYGHDGVRQRQVAYLGWPCTKELAETIWNGARAALSQHQAPKDDPENDLTAYERWHGI